jgi:6,7-dimethyl-8-ribityllumazine synthase
MKHAQGAAPSDLSAKGLRGVIIGSRWNEYLTDTLVNEARLTFLTLGGEDLNLEIIRVPGAFEIPLACQWSLDKGLQNNAQYDFIVTVGVIIEGATPHFDKLCTDVTDKISQLALTYRLPIGFGVVMAHNTEQAEERGLAGEANKGREAMLAAIEMACIKKKVFL